MQNQSSKLTTKELGPLGVARVARLNSKLCGRMRAVAEDQKAMLKIAAQFWSMVKRGHVRNCWIWTGTFQMGKYGKAVFEGKTISAHRMAYFLYYGAPPEGICVCHTCDNPKCVNPHHLFIGTFLDNIRDRDSKQRQAKGERSGSAKLNKYQVNTIRRLYRRRSIKPPILAAMFGVSRSTIRGILTGRWWRHVLS